MVSFHIVPVIVYLIVRVISYTFRFKDGTSWWTILFSYSKRHSFLWAAQLSASFDTDIAIVIDSRMRLSITTAYILIYVR